MRYFIILLLLLGCNTEKKLNKINAKHPEVIAKFARDHYPCAKSSIDTITNIEYDFIEIKCDTIITPGDKDTIVVHGKPKTYVVHDTQTIALPSTIKVVTKVIRDSSCEVLLTKCKSELQSEIKKHDKDAYWIKWLLILLAASIILHLIRKR